MILQPSNGAGDHFLGGAGAGGDQNHIVGVELVDIEILRSIDEERRAAFFLGQFSEPLRVAAVLRAEHNHLVGLLAEHAHCFLAILRRIADVFFRRADNPRETFLEPSDDSIGIVDTEGGLGEVGKLAARFKHQGVDFLGVFDENNGFGGFSHGADDFVVSSVADEDDGVVLFGEFDGLQMHLGDQRTGCVDRMKFSGLGEAPNFRSDSMGGEKDRGAFRNFLQIVNEYRTLGLECANDVLIVDNLVIDVNRRSKVLQSQLEALDGHVDPSAKTAGSSEDYFHSAQGSVEKKKDMPIIIASRKPFAKRYHP